MGGKSGAMDGKRVRTPWGDAADLRSMKMSPGRGNPPEESERSQRERLFGAIVALSAEQGYEATKIADIVKLAGVSRAAFYDHFRPRRQTDHHRIGPLLPRSLIVSTYRYVAGLKDR